MPIRPEWRHLYQGPEWAAIRARILARAGNRCEQCSKPNRVVLQVTRGGYWLDGDTWRDCHGEANAYCMPGPSHRTIYTSQCVITVAHLNHDPRDNRDENLKALCQHCHLKHDYNFHLATRRRNQAAAAGQLWLDDDLARGAVA